MVLAPILRENNHKMRAAERKTTINPTLKSNLLILLNEESIVLSKTHYNMISIVKQRQTKL